VILARDLNINPDYAFRKMPFVKLIYIVRAADEMAREMEYKQRKEAFFERSRLNMEKWNTRRRSRRR